MEGRDLGVETVHAVSGVFDVAFHVAVHVFQGVVAFGVVRHHHAPLPLHAFAEHCQMVGGNAAQSGAVAGDVVVEFLESGTSSYWMRSKK
jgi:hypothetical protein